MPFCMTLLRVTVRLVIVGVCPERDNVSKPFLEARPAPKGFAPLELKARNENRRLREIEQRQSGAVPSV